MFVQYEGSVPKRCLYCGGMMIENIKHECISGGYSSMRGFTKEEAEAHGKMLERLSEPIFDLSFDEAKTVFLALTMVHEDVIYMKEGTQELMTRLEEWLKKNWR